jgi:chaperonin cofactor prefoldin
MTPEDVERTLHVLLNSQARLVEDLGALQGEVRQIAGATLTLTGLVGQLADRLREHAEHADRRMTALENQMKATDERMKATDARIDRVESHLEALIAMFERHLADGHGAEPS